MSGLHLMGLLLAGAAALPGGVPHEARPPAPVPLAPAPGARLSHPEVTFRWRGEGLRFELRVAPTPAFRRNLVLRTAGTRAQLLLTPRRWWWQVRRAAAGGRPAGRWSAPRPLEVSGLARRLLPPGRPGPVSVLRSGPFGLVIRVRPAARAARYEVLVRGRVHAIARRPGRVAVGGLPCGARMWVTVRAVSAAGRRSAPAPGARAGTAACPDRLPPLAPRALRAVAVEQERVLLAWTPGRDPDGRVGDYVVTRNGRELGRPRDTRFWAVRLLPDTQYVFQVRTRDRVGRLSRDAAEITVRTAAPAPASGPFRLYVLATDRTARQRFRDHVRSATWAYPTFFDLAPDGRLDGRLDRPLARFARAQGVRVLARVHTSSFATLETHLVPGDARGALVTRLAQVASDPDLDGISIDFEPGMPRTGIGDLTRQQRWDRMRAAFTAFVEDLAERLHQEGRLLSVNVAVTWCERRDPVTALVVYCTDPSHPSAAARPRAYMFDYPRIVAAADELSLLSWGLHWTTSEPGPISDAAWLDAVLATTRELLVRAGAGAFWSRVTLGTQLYGIDWAYRVVRLDVLDPPTARPPAAPRCVDSDPASTARPRRRASTRDGRPVLEVEWICLTRPGRPLLHSEVVHLAAEVGASPQLDASSRERTFAFADPDGVRREVWFPDAATVESRLTQARSWGVQLALWRPGQEDPATWELR